MFDRNLYADIGDTIEWKELDPFNLLTYMIHEDYTQEDLMFIISKSRQNLRNYTSQRFCDKYGTFASSLFEELANQIVSLGLVFLGEAEDDVTQEDIEWYFSCSDQNLYTFNPNRPEMGVLKVRYDDGVEILRNTYNFEGTSESVFYDPYGWDSAVEVDLTFGESKPIDQSDIPSDNTSSDDASGGGDTGGDSSNNSNEVEDLTQTTQEKLKDDPSYGDPSDMNSDADTMGNSPDDSSPDGGEEEEDDSKDDPDDEGVKSKRRIRNNLVKLHAVINDSLDAMNSFAPSYSADSARKYYTIQNRLSTADDIIVKICTEQINDLTVDSLMKKYVTLCNIYDVSTRALRAFAKEYKEESEKRGKQIKSG